MQVSFSDVLSVIAIILALYSSTVVVRNRAQKDFFINKISELNNEYRDFVASMRNGSVSAVAIRNTLSYLTNRILTLYNVICREYNVSDRSLQFAHNDFLWNVTDLESIQEQFKNEQVSFSNEDLFRILSLYANVEKEFLNITVRLNLAKSIAPWDRPEENLGF